MSNTADSAALYRYDQRVKARYATKDEAVLEADCMTEAEVAAIFDDDAEEEES